MLLDDDYYEFTLKNCSEHEGLMVANELSLICLKAKAYTNNRQRREEGQKVRTDDIEKHKKDVIKLIATLEITEAVECPESIKSDLKEYFKVLRDDETDVLAITKAMKLSSLALDEISSNLNSIIRFE